MEEKKTMDARSEYEFRCEKVEKMREQGIQPYADRFETDKNIQEVVNESQGKELRHLEAISESPLEGNDIRLRGRLMLWREHGNLIFAQLKDESGSIQIAFVKAILGAESFKLLKLIDVADFIGVKGELFFTKKGELTLLLKEYTFLSKTLRPLPEKYHGLKDKEARYRRRYLDILSNSETKELLTFRAGFIRFMRDFYALHNFIEVQTPVLQNAASGALAKPFSTHHNALDIDVYLRIALETHQKELMGAGFEKTFEIGPVFRNEGIDPSHLQEFTMCEHYAAYWDYRDNMKFTHDMIQYILMKLKGTTTVKIKNREGVEHEVDFAGEWKEASFRDLLIADIGIDIDQYPDVESLRKVIQEKNVVIEDINKLGRGNLIDALYKKVSRPQIIGPLFLTQHPIDLSPLARKNDKNPNIVDRFQLVVNGWEIVNAYSELVDPIDQSQRFTSQAEAKDAGDDEAHGKDDEYVLAMEHGFPPISGWGMGIDRMVAILAGVDNLRETVWFPLMRPEEGHQDQE